MNYARTATFFAGLVPPVLVSAYVLGGAGAAALALVLSVATAAAMFRSASGLPGPSTIQEELETCAAGLGAGLPVAAIVRALAARAQIAPPRLFLIRSEAPNAFASGRNRPEAAIGVTVGLLSLLNAREIEGVLAHEIAHVWRRDARALTVTAAGLGIVCGLAAIAAVNGFSADAGPAPAAFAAGGAATAAAFAQMWACRQREFQADRAGAELCGKPLWIAAALERIESQTLPAADPGRRAAIAEALGFGGAPERVLSLFSTHPPSAERIRRLRQIAGLAYPWI